MSKQINKVSKADCLSAIEYLFCKTFINDMNRYLPGSILFTGLIFLLAVCTKPDEEALRLAFQYPALEFRMNLNHHDFPLDDAGQEQMIQEHLNNGYGGFTINVPYEHYLTDKGMKATLRFAEKAKNAGMELWQYTQGPPGHCDLRGIGRGARLQRPGGAFHLARSCVDQDRDDG